MRIALSGSHAVGKSTLIAELHDKLPAYETVDEPYYELLDEGHLFADRPSAEDLLRQLERSIAQLTTSRAADVLYDRCPADFLAYLSALKEHDCVREWITPATDALMTLDLIVFVPIEQPDRIADFAGAGRLRRDVDTLMREMLLADSFGFGRPVIQVHGSPGTRAKLVLAALRASGNRGSFVRGLTRS